MEIRIQGSAVPCRSGSATAEPLAEIAPASSADDLAREMASLPALQVLHEQGDYVVGVGTRADVPSIVYEISRLREVAFRAVGEGTGRACDLDEYDAWYEHLFVWSRSKRSVLGAYRLAKTQDVLVRRGPRGLYTNSLFDFDRDFFEVLGPAMELGRSFVRVEYQRSSRVLAMLWRGIGKLIARSPKCHTLFGPVSVSACYTERSRQLIAEVLSRGQYRHPLAHKTRALRPVVVDPAPRAGLLLPQLASAVAALEPDAKSLPTLVVEYAKLGGRFLSWSVDPDFQSALDGLVVVDLLRTDPRLLALYMGADAHAEFRRATTPASSSEQLVVQ